MASSKWQIQNARFKIEESRRLIADSKCQIQDRGGHEPDRKFKMADSK
jgi:hypothetical protein